MRTPHALLKLGVIGWEAGTRTPIRRSRVLQTTFRFNNFNHLGWHNAENFGKIRKIAARRTKGEMSHCGTSRRIPYLDNSRLEAGGFGGSERIRKGC